MNAFRIAIALVRVPRLFVSLLFFPIIAGIVLVYIQLIGTSLFATTVNKDSASMEDTANYFQNQNPIRTIVYGSGRALPPALICRWNLIEADGQKYEQPPDEQCAPASHDVAIQTDDVLGYDPSLFQQVFDGNIERIHICRWCQPNIVIKDTENNATTHIHGVIGFGLVTASKYSADAHHERIAITKIQESLWDNLGEQILYIRGLRRPIAIDSIAPLMAFILNISFLVLMTVWLALRAHRKVLDYFARSGALLPLVAASGKRNFYGAIWLITLLRVVFFLMAALPVTLSATFLLFTDQQLSEYLEPLAAELILWLIALSSSLALAMAIGSISDLKQRHSILSFAYRYVPLAVCLIGTAVWAVSFIIDTDQAIMIRNIVAALPVVGITPVLLAPAFQPALDILTFHSLLAVAAIVLVFKRNAHWFAAHLEDL